MTRQAWYPVRVADQILWLENLRNKFAGHAPTLGISQTKCDDAIADARWLGYTLGSWLPAVRDWQKACTAAAEQAQTGSGVVALLLPVFVPPVLPAASRGLPAVVARAPGALTRIFDTVADIKASDTYTDATPFPAAPTKWKYRAIYRVDDAQVGQWSAEVSVTVG